jgi:hypothetical protein
VVIESAADFGKKIDSVVRSAKSASRWQTAMQIPFDVSNFTRSL